MDFRTDRPRENRQGAPVLDHLNGVAAAAGGGEGFALIYLNLAAPIVRVIFAPRPTKYSNSVSPARIFKVDVRCSIRQVADQGGSYPSP